MAEFDILDEVAFQHALDEFSEDAALRRAIKAYIINMQSPRVVDLRRRIDLSALKEALGKAINLKHVNPHMSIDEMAIVFVEAYRSAANVDVAIHPTRDL